MTAEEDGRKKKRKKAIRGRTKETGPDHQSNPYPPIP